MPRIGAGLSGAAFTRPARGATGSPVEDTATSARKPESGTKNYRKTGACERATAFAMGPGTTSRTLTSRFVHATATHAIPAGYLAFGEVKSEGFCAQPRCGAAHPGANPGSGRMWPCPRTRPRPQRDPELARLAPPCLARDARLRHAGAGAPSREPGVAPKNRAAAPPYTPALIRWSVQEIHCVATRLAQRCIRPAHVITWSLWRRAHQAAAQRLHLALVPKAKSATAMLSRNQSLLERLQRARIGAGRTLSRRRGPPADYCGGYSQ